MAFLYSFFKDIKTFFFHFPIMVRILRGIKTAATKEAETVDSRTRGRIV